MSRRLLLVDDDDSIREIARLSLERLGDWQVVAASSGEQALASASSEPTFDAVLLDVMMPGLDGPSTLVELRAGPLGTAIPVVFLTAKLRPADRQELLDAGGAGVIAKPFDPMALPDELDEALGARSRRGRIRVEFADTWRRSRSLIESRIEAIDVGLRAMGSGASGQEEVRTALTESHRLAGLLGTLGLGEGTEIARRLEHGIEAHEDPRQLSALSSALRELVAGAEVESRTTSSGSA